MPLGIFELMLPSSMSCHDEGRSKLLALGIVEFLQDDFDLLGREVKIWIILHTAALGLEKKLTRLETQTSSKVIRVGASHRIIWPNFRRHSHSRNGGRNGLLSQMLNILGQFGEVLDTTLPASSA